MSRTATAKHEAIVIVDSSKKSAKQQRRLAAETAELAAQHRKDRQEQRRLQTFDLQPPRIVSWFYETVVVPTLVETDTVVERMQKLLIMLFLFFLPVLAGLFIRHTFIAFESPQPGDGPGVGGRLGCHEFAIQGVFVHIAIAVIISALVYLRVTKRIALANAAHMIVIGISFVLTFFTHATFPIFAICAGFCTLSVFAFGPEYPVWTFVFVFGHSLFSVWSSYNMNGLHTVSFYTAADLNASLPSNNNSHNDHSNHDGNSMNNNMNPSNVSGIIIGRMKAQRVSLFVHFTGEGYFVGSPHPYLGTTAERFINWFLAFNLACTVVFGLVSFMSQMGVVARQQLANAAAGRTMAAALRNFDIAQLEDAVDQYKALPYRDDGMWAHLQSMAQHIALLGRFCPRDIITALRQDGDRPAEAGLEERASVCVLVCELCNTCRLIEKVRPERELEKLLNGITARVTQIVAEHGGTLLATDGCQFRAVWGAPQRLHAKHSGVLACCAALHLVHMLREEFATMVERQFGVRDLRFRVGIHRGAAVVGNIGSTVVSWGGSQKQRCEYVVLGEAPQIALVVSVLEFSAARSSIMITRNVLMDDSSRRDVQHATDLVNFAVREVCLFAHDTKPLQVFTGLQLIGITSAGRDLVKQTTKWASNAAGSALQDSLEEQQFTGSSSPPSASALLSMSRRCKLRSSGHSNRNGNDTRDGRRAGRDMQRVRHMWNASESDNSASDSDVNTNEINPNENVRNGSSVGDENDEHVLINDTHKAPAAAAANYDDVNEEAEEEKKPQQRLQSGKNGAVAAPATAVSSPASPTLDGALEQAVSALSEQHRNIIKWSLRTVLRDNFSVDDLGCDILATLTQAQQVFLRGMQSSFRDAARLCTQAILNPIAEAEAENPIFAERKREVSPHSQPRTKKILTECGVDRNVAEAFVRRCMRVSQLMATNKRATFSRVLVVDVTSKSEF